jgi:D-alanyl-D-alanine carboxypeptidase (penicillin-binding protein 5/6)
MAPKDHAAHLFRTLLTGLLLATVAPAVAAAQTAGDAPAPDPPVLTGDFVSAHVVDAETGYVLVAINDRERRQPASMLKMMTELIVLERVAEGDIRLDEDVRVSAKASRMGGSQVYLAHNEVFTVEELLMALAIHSANDAAVALAEHVAGSTDAFVDLMNLRAQELGMTDTHFETVHGLPPGRGQRPDLSSARDMAILGRELIRYEHARHWASTRTAPFRNGEFTLYNPNKLVGTYRGLDGIKTGYTAPAGFCVTASAVQKGKRLISVVMGCSTDRARANETTRLLSYGFNLYQQVEVIAADDTPLPDPVRVRDGKRKEAVVTYGQSLTVSLPRDRVDDVVVEHRLDEAPTAPLAAGDPVGTAVVKLDGVELGSVPIVIMEEMPRGNWLDRVFH